jgi:hypothetical protein
VAADRHHVVTVAPEHERLHARHRDAELPGEEFPVARRIQDAGHADDLVLREPGHLLHQGDHGVERVRDDDDERLRRVLLERLGDRLDDLGVDADEVVAAHARLAGDAGGHDADIGTAQVGVVVAALDLDVEALDGPGGRQVERLALR